MFSVSAAPNESTAFRVWSDKAKCELRLDDWSKFGRKDMSVFVPFLHCIRSAFRMKADYSSFDDMCGCRMEAFAYAVVLTMFEGRDLSCDIGGKGAGNGSHNSEFMSCYRVFCKKVKKNRKVNVNTEQVSDTAIAETVASVAIATAAVEESTVATALMDEREVSDYDADNGDGGSDDDDNDDDGDSCVADDGAGITATAPSISSPASATVGVDPENCDSC